MATAKALDLLTALKDALHEVIATCEQDAHGDSPPETATLPAKRKRRTKAEMEAARAEEAEAAKAKEADEVGDGDSGEEEAKPRTRRRKKAAKRVEQEGPSVDDVRNALLKVIEEYGNEGAAEVLEDFKVEKVSELGTDQYADVISAAADYLTEENAPAPAGALE